jgi:hypothetical protein
VRFCQAVLEKSSDNAILPSTTTPFTGPHNYEKDREMSEKMGGKRKWRKREHARKNERGGREEKDEYRPLVLCRLPLSRPSW